MGRKRCVNPAPDDRAVGNAQMERSHSIEGESYVRHHAPGLRSRARPLGTAGARDPENRDRAALPRPRADEASALSGAWPARDAGAATGLVEMVAGVLIALGLH